MLAVMLGELADRDHRSWADCLDIQRRVLSYRLAVHDRSRDLQRDGHALLAAVERHGLVGLPTSAATADISAVDEHGNACAITMSSGYGAGMVIPGTGILLNNALGEPELNRLGLHAVASGTRLASNMAPTTARGGAGSTLAVGSPGADRITTALLQVLGHTMLGGDTLQEAIDEARAHVRFLPDGSVRRRPRAVGDDLRGHRPARARLVRVPRSAHVLRWGQVDAELVSARTHRSR